MMKKILIALALVLALAGCSEDRSQVLKVYNWADYIDEDLLDEFEQWYEEETGEKVEIIYQTFDINETMLSKIELGHEDYDVVCPSDYIIERMLKNDLLLPLDKDFGDTPNYLDNIAPYISETLGQIEENGRNARDYSVGYILPVRIGDKVTADATLCTLYARNEADAIKAEAAIRAAITIGDAPVERPPLCYAVVTARGVERA